MKGPPYNRRKGVASVGYKISNHYTREIPECMLMRAFNYLNNQESPTGRTSKRSGFVDTHSCGIKYKV